MKYFYGTLIFLTLATQKTLAADAGVLGGLGSGATTKIRNGDIHISDLGNILKYAIDWTIGFAGTIAVIAIIIGAYKMMFGAVGESNSTSDGKKYIAGALIGFAIASLAWFFVKLIIDNFS